MRRSTIDRRHRLSIRRHLLCFFASFLSLSTSSPPPDPLPGGGDGIDSLFVDLFSASLPSFPLSLNLLATTRLKHNTQTQRPLARLPRRRRALRPRHGHGALASVPEIDQRSQLRVGGGGAFRFLSHKVLFLLLPLSPSPPPSLSVFQKNSSRCTSTDTRSSEARRRGCPPRPCP